MWVLRRIPADGTSWDNMSPWKGCLYIDQDDNGAWYATNLAKPTRFTSREEAEDCARVIRAWPSFLESEIQVAIYEEIFQSVFPPVAVAVSAVMVEKKRNACNAGAEVQNWNWNDGELEPFWGKVI